MLASTLFALSDAGYTSSQQLRDDGDRPVPSVIMGILFTETALEISGHVYQIMIETEQALAGLFTRRLGYSEGSSSRRSSHRPSWRRGGSPCTGSPTWWLPESTHLHQMRLGRRHLPLTP